MLRFYFLLWLNWSVRVTLCSIIMACGLSFLITFYLYINQGLPNFSIEVFQALFQVFKFWFPISLSLTLLIALFRSLKYIFNRCFGEFKLQLLECSSSSSSYKTPPIIEEIGYGDLVKVWRKWLMLMIWLVGAFMIFALVFSKIFTSYGGIFEWFSIYYLFIFILLAGYFSFIILGGRCKKVKVVRC